MEKMRVLANTRTQGLMVALNAQAEEFRPALFSWKGSVRRMACGKSPVAR
jgi:hypothetical protein